MELGHFDATLRRWYWLIVLVPLAAGSIVFWLTQQQPSTYTAQVDLTVGPGVDNPTTDLNALKASAQFLQTFTQLAKTRPILQQVMDELKLDMNLGGLQGNISVSSDSRTQVMTISVRDANRRRAIAIANSLANALVRYSNANKGPEAGLDAAQLSAQIEQLIQQRDAIQMRIREIDAELGAANRASSGSPLAEQQAKIKKLEAAVLVAGDPKLEQAIADRQARIKELEAGLRSTTSILAQQLILDELLREDGLVLSDQAALKELRQQVADQLTQERNTLQTMQNAQAMQVNQLTGELNVQRLRLSDMQRAINDLYTTLQNVATNQVKVIDPAVSASLDEPNAWLNATLAAVASLLLILTLVFAFDVVGDVLRSPEDLARVEGAHLLGTIAGHAPLKGVGRETLVVHALPQTRAAENLRMLSAKLVPANSASGARSLLLCSLDRGQDAAELASNLALILAQVGKRVVLCDANLHRPIITQLFKLEGQKGLADALADKAAKPALFPIAWAPGLYVLPRGTGNPAAFELLASAQTEQLAESLQHDADVVLYVGAPLTSFADSLALAPRVDGVVLLARQGKTRRKYIADAIQSLNAVGARFLGVVLMQNRGDGIHIIPSAATQARESKDLSSIRPQTSEIVTQQLK